MILEQKKDRFSGKQGFLVKKGRAITPNRAPHIPFFAETAKP